MKSKFMAVKLLRSDVKLIDDLKIHKTEPRWSVIERAVSNLIELHKRKFPEKKELQ